MSSQPGDVIGWGVVAEESTMEVPSAKPERPNVRYRVTILEPVGGRHGDNLKARAAQARFQR